MRLQVTEPTNILGEAQNRFWCPSPVSQWRRFANGALPNHQALSLYKERLVSNVVHRLQYLEFIVAILLHDIERVRGGRDSTIHVSVTPFLIHNHTTTVHSVLEGIGSYIFRYKMHEAGTSRHIPEQITTPQ